MRVLLEGRPGVGKTTVATRLAELLRSRGRAVGGFVTEELRESGRRVGFCVKTFAGQRATLAHVDFGGSVRVGKYGVALEAFERIALLALADVADGDLVVVDELGKMELASQPFCEAVLGLFERPLGLVAAVHVFPHPFTDALKRRHDVELISVTAQNREALPLRLADRIAGPSRSRPLAR